MNLVLPFTFLLAAPAGARQPAPNEHSKIGSDHAVYEAVTGESADEDKSAWDEFYRNKHFVFGKDPVSFLKDQLPLVPKGRAFVPAMGEGRNAIYLAKRGFNVDGNDLSDVAVDKALAEARTQHVVIHAAAADLNQAVIPENAYDLVMVSLFYEKSLMPKFKKSVKKGGYIMLYERLSSAGTRETNLPNDDFAVNGAELKATLSDFQIKVYKEYIDHDIHVVGVLAKKP